VGFARATVVGVGIVSATLLSACGSGGPSQAVLSTPNPSAATTSTTNLSTTTTEPTASSNRPWACAPNALDCTSEQVIATVANLYEDAGATKSEAACLAPVTGTGTHAVNQAFEAPTDAQTKAAIACVGSEARLRVLATAVAGLFTPIEPVG
jgi:hypothetical protein